MLYIIGCVVSKYYYMNDTDREEVSHIVEATSDQEAMNKVTEFYQKQDREYSVSHDLVFYYCHGLIT